MDSKSIDKAMAESNLMMQAGQREEAKAILKALIERNPPSEDLYEDTIYNYLLGGAYLEAKELARRYERNFGAKPTPELSLESIEERERRHRAAQTLKVFRRLSLWERGNLPRYLPWSRVVWREIRIEPIAIVLKRRLRTHRLTWEQIRWASLTKKQSFYGENAGYVLKLIVLKTWEGKTYRIDVSTVIPELENLEELEQAVRERLTLEEGPVEERDAVADWLGGLLILLVIVSAMLLLLYVT